MHRAAFCRPCMHANRNGSARSRAGPHVTRRTALHLFAVAAALPAATIRAEPAKLPPGAAELARVLAARERWTELGGAVQKGNFTDKDWDNARLYLRAFYSLAADMKTLAKPWERDVRGRADEAAAQLQKVVKGMDPAARDHDANAFMEAHALADGAVQSFLNAYRDAAAADVPDEL